MPYWTKIEVTYFLFLRSTPLLRISFFARADPWGIAYCIGEGTGAGGAVTAIVAGTCGTGCTGS